MIRLSVIIVNYNVKYFLEQALLSVRNASKNMTVEVFVVDNNSVDGSAEMVKKKFPEVVFIGNKANVGFSKANNQAIGFKSSSTGAIQPLAGWSLLEPIEEEEVQESEIIEVVKLTEKPTTRGKVAFTSSGIEALGLEVGDVVGFKENRDYRIKIDGKEYYRTRLEDLMYVER